VWPSSAPQVCVLTDQAQAFALPEENADRWILTDSAQISPSHRATSAKPGRGHGHFSGILGRHRRPTDHAPSQWDDQNLGCRARERPNMAASTANASAYKTGMWMRSGKPPSVVRFKCSAKVGKTTLRYLIFYFASRRPPRRPIGGLQHTQPMAEVF